MWETWVQSLGWKDPRRRQWLPTPVFWPGEFRELYGVAKSPTRRSDVHVTEESALACLTVRSVMHCYLWQWSFLSETEQASVAASSFRWPVVVLPLCSPVSNFSHYLWQIGSDRSNILSLPRLGCKSHCFICCGQSLSLSWLRDSEGSWLPCCQQLCERMSVVRNICSWQTEAFHQPPPEWA